MVMDEPAALMVIVPPVGANVTLPLMVNAPATLKLVLYCDCAVGVAAIVRLLNVLVPVLALDEPTALIVIVPPVGANVTPPLIVRAAATEKLVLYCDCAAGVAAIVKF